MLLAGLWRGMFLQILHHLTSLAHVLDRYVFSVCYYIGPLFDFVDANASAAPALLESFQYATQLTATTDSFVTNILLQAFEQCRTNLSTRAAPPFLGTDYGPTVSIDAGGLPPPLSASSGSAVPATGRTGVVSAGPMAVGGSAAGALAALHRALRGLHVHDSVGARAQARSLCTCTFQAARTGRPQRHGTMSRTSCPGTLAQTTSWPEQWRCSTTGSSTTCCQPLQADGRIFSDTCIPSWTAGQPVPQCADACSMTTHLAWGCLNGHS